MEMQTISLPKNEIIELIQALKTMILDWDNGNLTESIDVNTARDIIAKIGTKVL